MQFVFHGPLRFERLVSLADLSLTLSLVLWTIEELSFYLSQLHLVPLAQMFCC